MLTTTKSPKDVAANIYIAARRRVERLAQANAPHEVMCKAIDKERRAVDGLLSAVWLDAKEDEGE